MSFEFQSWVIVEGLITLDLERYFELDYINLCVNL